jgi:hypothetical protein
MGEKAEVQIVVDAAVDACSQIIDRAVWDNRHLSANAIRMTVIDMLASAVVLAVAKHTANKVPIGEIIDRHTARVCDFCAVAEAVGRNLGAQG